MKKDLSSIYSIDLRMFGRRIEQWRESRELSTRQLADMIGVSHSQLRNWELGESEPSISNTWRISRIMGKGLSELLKGEPNDGDLVSTHNEGVVEEFVMPFMQLDLEDRSIMLEVERMLLDGPEPLRQQIRDYIETLRRAYPPRKKRRQARKSIGFGSGK